MTVTKPIRRAIINCPDTGPLESLVEMLHSVGIVCAIPSGDLLRFLRRIGCSNIITIDTLVENWGYRRPNLAGIDMLGQSSLDRNDGSTVLIDLKAHVNAPRIVDEFPRMKNRIIWYRINGAKPEPGIESSPPVPIMTPNQWYRDAEFQSSTGVPNLVFWPPFVGASRYNPSNARARIDPPVCLLHNAAGWGYGKLMERLRNNPRHEYRLRVYGRGSPDGLIPNSDVPRFLAGARAMIHLKSSDAPGYALYEAIHAHCPVIIPERLIWRCRMEELFNEYSALIFQDGKSHESLTDAQADSLAAEVGRIVDKTDTLPKTIARIAGNAYNRLNELMWKPDAAGKAAVANFFAAIEQLPPGKC